jgi:hypothetical protein
MHVLRVSARMAYQIYLLTKMHSETDVDVHSRHSRTKVWLLSRGFSASLTINTDTHTHTHTNTLFYTHTYTHTQTHTADRARSRVGGQSAYLAQGARRVVAALEEHGNELSSVEGSPSNSSRAAKQW